MFERNKYFKITLKCHLNEMLPIALKLLFFPKLVKFFKDVDLSKNYTLDLI